MIKKTDSPATRSIQVEIEVPGTPEQVWQAIATGPGITAWFVPSEVAERKGGDVTFHMDPGMDSTGVVTGWEPPRRFAFEEKAWSPGAPPVATEIFVEARSGGTCVVRLVNSLFTSSADWDDQLGSFEKGWAAFLHTLRLYLTHFPGQRCSYLSVTGNSSASEDEAWARFSGALGLARVSKGQRVAATSPGLPNLAGIVERIADRELILRTDQPAPGVALITVHDCGGGVQTMISFYLYGDQAQAVGAREEPAWRAWMDAQFPAAAAAQEARATTS